MTRYEYRVRRYADQDWRVEVLWDGTPNTSRYLCVDLNTPRREASPLPRQRAQQLLTVVDVVRSMGPSPMPAILAALPAGTGLESARRAVYRAAYLGRLTVTTREARPGRVVRVYGVGR